MPDLSTVLKALESRNLKLNVSDGGVEVLELRMNGKNIDLEIKNREEFKKMLKELKK